MIRRIRQLAAAGAVLLLGLFSGTAQAQLSARDGLPDFQKVNDFLYRGAQPTEAGIRNLAQLGVNTVINLQALGEGWAKEKEMVESLGMRYIAMPMAKSFSVDVAQVLATVKLLEDPDNGRIFIHCQKGRDRTGVVIACFRIAHDRWTNDQAVQEANALKMNWLQFTKRRFILDYRKSPVENTADAAAKAP